MLNELDVEQARFVTLLAEAARASRDELLNNVAEADLAPLNAARGQHNPTAALGFDPLRQDASQTAALQEAVATLYPTARIELYTPMRIGQGDMAAKKWHSGLAEATTLGEQIITAAVLGDPDLHHHIMKALYQEELGS